MHENDSDDLSPATKRMAAEDIIRRYPDIASDELKAVLRYLKKEASAMDKAMIASDQELIPRYRQLCHDHYLNRLHPVETVIVVAMVVILGTLLLFLSTIAKTI